MPSAQIAATCGQSDSVISRSRTRSIIVSTRIELLDFAAMEIRRPDPATGSGEAAYVHAHDRAVYGDGYVELRAG